MKKKAGRKSPLPVSPASPTPQSIILENRNSNKKPPTASVFRTQPQNSLASISDLKDMASSRFHYLKSDLIDHSHSQILNDLESFQSRLHKRFKIQSQTCQQVMDEADKDFKKMSKDINESCEAMKESYEELMTDAQATTSRVCKTSIPELTKSYEKAIGILQSRYGIPSA
ncbi:hypothetical protein P3X46_032207 [Hevea brasiliensis]|uniref:Uncharacterized protein n=1 Tax=Hevea brasiliensis TaxID=3981 RepID=A0ABQ9KCK4_HEVBR|nr:uncharacterized protein LOC110639818 [Hevea brasiliensis]KAJ9134980.1 hypothetical protein P3X46_032207 [Hevea brasiliensis]